MLLVVSRQRKVNRLRFSLVTTLRSFLDMRGMGDAMTITASLESGDAVRSGANSSLNAGMTYYATPHPSIASSPKT